ncbi:MAG: hypothetical protein AUJ70_05215 [Candidatus Omnitrophica bacterium CG1_02_40_15]|nr:MAG: hypothetical protein AUJ70_05215 [Candidatus Omnitrophica bacterium CG1_02_40_15]
MKTKIAIVKCKDYERVKVEQAVKKAFDLLGGMDAFIKRSEKVLIKPNMLSARLPEDGICTHLEVIRAVVKSVRDCGAVPCIGDNPGGSLSPAKAYEGSGILSLAKEIGVELKDVKGIKVVNGIPIANYFFECDKIISLPKMKTHILMGLTGAIKNMYGAVAGLHKSELHKKFPSPEEFVKVLIDTFKIVKPNLVLMDGIVAMDQDGPSSGRLRNPGLLIAGEDSVTIDAVFARLAGIEPLSIITTREAYAKKLGEADLKNIEILGESVKENLIKDFEIPGKNGLITILGPCAKFAARFIKFGPHIDKGLCKKCMICQDSCPVLAITIEPKNSSIDLKKCIKCMCCHEVCPHKAIELKRNFLAKVFGL